MMRDKRYMLSRRRYNAFERTTPSMFKTIDEAQRRLDHPKPVFGFWVKCGAVIYIIFIVAINVYVARRAAAPSRPRPSSSPATPRRPSELPRSYAL